MKLSIITISYNAVEEIERTLRSVYSQTYKDFEHIIIDGASTDGTVEIIKKYKQSNTVFVSEKDNGIYHAMNKGIKLAKGEYLLFLNAGDFLNNNNIFQNIIIYLNGVDLGIGKCNFLNEKNKLIKVFGENIQLPFHLEIGSLTHPATFIKKELFNKYGFYDETFKIAGDYDFFAKVVYQNNCSYKMINEIISNFYYGGNSTHSDFALKKKEEDEIIRKRYIYSSDLYKKGFIRRKIRFFKKYPLFFINYNHLRNFIKA